GSSPAPSAPRRYASRAQSRAEHDLRFNLNGPLRRAVRISGRSQGEQLAPQLLDLVAELRRVLEAQLLRRREHLLLQLDHQTLELLARHPLDLLAAASP